MSPPVEVRQNIEFAHEVEERCVVISERRLRSTLKEILRNSPDSNVTPEQIEHLITRLEEPADEDNEDGQNDDETDLILSEEERLEIRREGQLLVQISEVFIDKKKRQKIRQIASRTDLKQLDYVKFGQIMADLRSEGWTALNKELVIVMCMYFKDLIFRALQEGEIKKCVQIIGYFFKYLKESRMAMALKDVISFGLTNKKIVIATGMLILSSAAYFLYTRMR